MSLSQQREARGLTGEHLLRDLNDRSIKIEDILKHYKISRYHLTNFRVKYRHLITGRKTPNRPDLLNKPDLRTQYELKVEEQPSNTPFKGVSPLSPIVPPETPQIKAIQGTPLHNTSVRGYHLDISDVKDEKSKKELEQILNDVGIATN